MCVPARRNRNVTDISTSGNIQLYLALNPNFTCAPFPTTNSLEDTAYQHAALILQKVSAMKTTSTVLLTEGDLQVPTSDFHTQK